LLLACLVAPLSVLASVADLPRTTDAIEIDGFLKESAWQQAVRIELGVEVEPAENTKAMVATRAYLMEDGENLYVAFEADDPNPEIIRAHLRDRDAAWSDDYVGIILDTYNDERRAFEFFANPLGVQMDKTRDDTVNSNPWEFDDSWDAIWDSAGHINETGYVVEMRIPLSQLRFPDVAGIKTWGYDLKRAYPRNKNHQFSNHRRDRNRSCYLCQVGKLKGLEGSRPSRDLEIVPTLTALQNETTDDPGFVPIEKGDLEAEAGLTVRWGVTPDLTANIAINPDFSQIEADVAQLDVNNRFALFFPEKRPFFLEGADYFNTPIDAVFTRTVASPDFGAKLTGKKGDHTFGVFAAQDAETNLLFPGLFSSDTETLEQSNSVFVGRYSRGLGDASSIGGLVTVRDGDNYHNYVGGIDARWKISDQHSISFQHLETDTEYPSDTAIEFEQPLDAFRGRGTRFGYDYDSRNWTGRVRYIDMNAGFRLDAGFQNVVGGTYRVLAVGRIFHGTSDTWWSRIRANLDLDRLQDEDGRLAERKTMLRIGVGGPLQSWTSVTFQDVKERDEGVFYDMSRVRLFVDIVPVRGLRFEMVGTIGDQIDYDNGRLGKRRSFQPNVDWNITRKLMLRLRGTFSELETQNGVPIFDAALLDTRLTWQFNLRSFLRLTVQTKDIERNLDEYIDPEELAREQSVGRQLLYSYKINPQTVFFLGYSDSYVEDDNIDRPIVEDRTIFMKIGYAWTP